MARSGIWDEILLQAQSLFTTGQALSMPDALRLVCEAHPELYQQYVEEQRRGAGLATPQRSAMDEAPAVEKQQRGRRSDAMANQPPMDYRTRNSLATVERLLVKKAITEADAQTLLRGRSPPSAAPAAHSRTGIQTRRSRHASPSSSRHTRR